MIATLSAVALPAPTPAKGTLAPSSDPTYGRGNASKWPPACTPEGADKYQYAPPGGEGVPCCTGLTACVEERSETYPGYGKPGLEKVVVCREECAAPELSVAKIAALANTCVYRLSPYIGWHFLGGQPFANKTFCEPMRLAGWEHVESYSAIDDVYSDTDNADLFRTASGDCLLSIHGADIESHVGLAFTNETVPLYGIPGFSKTHGGGEVMTILGKIIEMHGSLATWAATCPGELHVSGHSMGGAAASIIAFLANKNGDPMGMKKTVSQVFLFGSNPGASFTMTNDQSADGCFSGASYYMRVPAGNLIDLGIASGHASSAPWMAQLGYPYPGVMLQPKIKYTALDMTGPPTKNGTAANVGIFLDESKLVGPSLVTPCGQDPPGLVANLANYSLFAKSDSEAYSPPFGGTLASYGLHMPWMYAVSV